MVMLHALSGTMQKTLNGVTRRRFYYWLHQLTPCTVRIMMNAFDVFIPRHTKTFRRRARVRAATRPNLPAAAVRQQPLIRARTHAQHPALPSSPTPPTHPHTHAERCAPHPAQGPLFIQKLGMAAMRAPQSIGPSPGASCVR